jgi:hypothetical protein
MFIPFELTKENRIYIAIEFLRFDTLHTVSSQIKKLCKRVIEKYIQNASWSRFLTDISLVFKYLLVFILYVHCLACVFAYLEYDNEKKTDPEMTSASKIYVKSLYFVIVTFTTVGFGDMIPSYNTSTIFILFSMVFGIVILGILDTNVINLFTRLISFSSEEENSFKLEEFIHNLQKSVKKKIPQDLRSTIINYFTLKDKIYPSLIQNSIYYEKLPSKLKKSIQVKIFKRLISNYSIFFNECSSDFVLNIFSKLKTRM